MFILLLSLLIGSELGSAQSTAAKKYFALYQVPGADQGECLRQPMDVGRAKAVLSSNGIRQIGKYTQHETIALAKGIERLQTLNGGRPIPAKWRTPYTYITTRSGRLNWNQAASTIYVRRPPGQEQRGANGTRLMHELGHKVGNAMSSSGRQNAYSEYNRFVGKNRCKISIYCTRKHNEEFAEVFAAYLVSPSKLQQECPKAYQFFATKVLPGVDARGSCQRGFAPSLMGTSHGGTN